MSLRGIRILSFFENHQQDYGVKQNQSGKYKYNLDPKGQEQTPSVIVMWAAVMLLPVVKDNGTVYESHRGLHHAD